MNVRNNRHHGSRAQVKHCAASKQNRKYNNNDDNNNKCKMFIIKFVLNSKTAMQPSNQNPEVAIINCRTASTDQNMIC